MRTERRDRPGRGGASSRPSDRPPHRAPQQRPRSAAPLPRAANRDLLYGRNAVIEALRGPRAKHRLWIAAGVREDDRIRSLISVATAAKLEIDRCPREMLDDLTSRANHQGVVLEAGPFAYATLDDIIERRATILILDHLQDPQNFGTLMRAAEAAAVGGVVIPNDRTVAVTPAVVNASAGAVEHIAVAQVPNLARTADELTVKGWWIVGLDTGPDAVELFSTDLPSPVALIVGAEGSGIGQNVRRRCDLIVSLPLRGKVASLNAATAGAIALFDLVRRS